MMSKIHTLKIAYIFVLALFLSSCTPNIYYVKPELIGKLYDSKTKKPISRKMGFISFYLNEEGQVQTNEKGQFKINAVARKYYFIEPNMQEISMSAPQIYINFKGYKPEIIDYSERGIPENTQPNPGAKKIEKVDIGIIYLEPEK